MPDADTAALLAEARMVRDRGFAYHTAAETEAYGQGLITRLAQALRASEARVEAARQYRLAVHSTETGIVSLAQHMALEAAEHTLDAALAPWCDSLRYKHREETGPHEHFDE